MSHAAGTFQVSITPAPPASEAAPDLPGRMILAKTFHGGIEGTGAGEMLAVREGQSGAYVAMERVTGVVNGRNGSFALVHRGVMTAEGQELLITIVPGSGTGDLAGIGGVLPPDDRQGRTPLRSGIQPSRPYLMSRCGDHRVRLVWLRSLQPYS